MTKVLFGFDEINGQNIKYILEGKIVCMGRSRLVGRGVSVSRSNIVVLLMNRGGGWGAGGDRTTHMLFYLQKG